MKHPQVAALVALGFVALAFAAGPHRVGALVGVGIAAATGMASLLAMSRLAPKGLNGALMVVTLGFLVRMLLVALGTILIVKAGESVQGFVAGFFVPFFFLAAIEAAYVHSLRRSTGTP